MYKNPLIAVCPRAPGTNITTSGASASAAIPNALSGTVAKFVTLTCTAACYVRFGTSGLTAAVADFHLPAGVVQVVNVVGCTHIAAIQVSAGGTLTITPLEA
jgi:hypothetical protein